MTQAREPIAGPSPLARAAPSPAIRLVSSDKPLDAPYGGGLQALCIVAQRHGIAANPPQIAHDLAFRGTALTGHDLIRAAKAIGLRARLVQGPTVAVAARWSSEQQRREERDGGGLHAGDLAGLAVPELRPEACRDPTQMHGVQEDRPQVDQPVEPAAAARQEPVAALNEAEVHDGLLQHGIRHGAAFRRR